MAITYRGEKFSGYTGPEAAKAYLDMVEIKDDQEHE